MNFKSTIAFKGLLKKQVLLLLIALMCSELVLKAQNIDLETVGKNLTDKIKDKKPFKLSGGINASSVFYTGNMPVGRDPFSYILNGSVNLSIYKVNIPLSFSFTNRGFSYNYSYPRLPNKLSLHPKYKWVTGHIGDVSMTFSPYTLNGVIFRGAGFDFVPTGSRFKYSIMYGRLQKAVEYRPDNGNTLATYKRMGYGLKAGYENGSKRAIFSLFSAKDILNSLTVKPDSLQIYPQANTSLSFEGSLPVMKSLVAKVEYGISVLTKDIRAPKNSDTLRVTGLNKILGGRISSSLYKAFKTELNYTLGSAMLGVGYERVDPGYQTLGAYYFTNDLENITAIFAQSLFKGKVNLSGNLGIQRDDLDRKKSGGTRRTVGSANITYAASKRFTSTLSYSNFQTYTNVKPQFQYINQQTPFDNLDTLNFRQLSQNSNLNINYVVSDNKERPQNLNFNLGLQDSYDMQGGVISKGNASRFYNFAGSYSFVNNPQSLNFLTAFNLTYNQIASNNLLTMGPTFGFNKGLWDKKVSTGLSCSYNQTTSAGIKQNSIFSIRANAAYVLKKKHNFGVNMVTMNRKSVSANSYSDYTATITYNYSF